MAGILDNKKRIMDVVITEEGRRQMSTGEMKIDFISFTDRHTYYEFDPVSGSVNPSDRLFIEAMSLPQDNITFETNAVGQIISFSGGSLETDVEGHIYQRAGGGEATSAKLTKVISPDVFSSLTASLLKQTIDNFNNQFLIGTHPLNDVSSSFGIKDSRHVTFNVSDSGYSHTYEFVSDVDNLLPNPFHDTTLFTRHTDYMPPTYVSTAGEVKLMVKPGNSYPDLTDGKNMETFTDAVSFLYKGRPDFKNNPELGRTATPHPSKTVILEQSGSPNMNIACQIFETARNDTKITKLDVVDTGYWSTREGVVFRVVHAGKVFIDSLNIPCFVRMFSLVFSNSTVTKALIEARPYLTMHGHAGHFVESEPTILKLIQSLVAEVDDFNAEKNVFSGVPTDMIVDRSGVKDA